MSEALTPGTDTNGANHKLPILPQEPCTFCSSKIEDWRPYLDYPRFVGMGKSLDDLITSSKTCLSCAARNDRLRKYECELHDFGAGASTQLDVIAIPHTANTNGI